MSFFTAQELAEARAEHVASFDKTCTIGRRSDTRTRTGESKSSYVDLYPSRPCRFGEFSSSERQDVAGRYANQVVHPIVFGWNEDIQVGDRLTFGTVHLYVVQAPLAALRSDLVALQVLAVRRGPPHD